MFAAQLRTALAIAWLAVTLVSVPVMAAPFLLPADTIFTLAPICEAKAAGGECWFCGMTTAFVYIGHGMLDDALASNMGSLPLFSLLAWNLCVALWFAAGEIKDALPRRKIRVVIKPRVPAGEISWKP